MKKVLLLSLLLVAFASCTPKHKKLVKAHLNTVLNDFKSYEPVLWGTIDSLFSSYKNDSIYKEHFNKWVEHQTTAIEIQKEYNSNRYKYDYHKIQELIALEEEKAKEHRNKTLMRSIEFKPEFIGWKLHHSYRAKNKIGALILQEHEFHFNIPMTAVTNMVEIEEDED